MNEQAHQAYLRARGELALLQELVTEREARILSRLVTSWESGTLTGETARDGVVAIAALRTLIREAERRYRVAGVALTATEE